MPEKTFDFDYSRHLPGNWESYLLRLKSEGVKVLRSRIFWGSHESLRGVRDFTKMSRLRLEKFLTLAQDLEFQVELVCGLNLEAESYPEWTYLLKPPALVPANLHPFEKQNFSLKQIPSLKNPIIKQAFLEFLDEVFSLCMLYLEPEGTLQNFYVDLTSESLDAEAAESEEFAAAFQNRYENIEKLNLTYGTAFRSFETSLSRHGFRALADKRPWLAAFDYKSARLARIESLFENMKTRPAAAPFRNRLNLFESTSGIDELTSFPLQVLCDEVPVERCGRKVAPLSLSGVPLLSSVLSCRLLEVINQRAPRAGFSVSTFSSRHPRLLVILCSRYLTKVQHEEIDAHLDFGGAVFFPLQVPHYDESLLPYTYASNRTAEVRNVCGQTFQVGSRKNGEVFLASPPSAFGEPLWNYLCETISALGKAECE